MTSPIPIQIWLIFLKSGLHTCMANNFFTCKFLLIVTYYLSYNILSSVNVNVDTMNMHRLLFSKEVLIFSLLAPITYPVAEKATLT